MNTDGYESTPEISSSDEPTLNEQFYLTKKELKALNREEKKKALKEKKLRKEDKLKILNSDV